VDGPWLWPRDPIKTLSPLARPGKALALEAQIELWSATSTAPLFSFRTDVDAVDEQIEELSNRAIKTRATEAGLAAMTLFGHGVRSAGRIFS
jgi:hypothetical protein